jgi:hypothetical protein
MSNFGEAKKPFSEGKGKKTCENATTKSLNI